MINCRPEKKYLHVHNRARNVYVHIYDALEVYMHVTSYEEVILNFVWLIYLILHFTISLV